MFILLKKLCHCLSIFLLLISYSVTGAVILQYHHVSEKLPKVTSISEADFRAHLAYLKSQNFNVVKLSSLVNALKNNEPVTDKTVAITFDDGYVNNYTNAAPILEEFGYPYTIFVNPSLIDEKKSYLMTWQQIKELTQRGAEIANHNAQHNYMHHKLNGESIQNWKNRIKRDIESAESRITQETGHNLRMLAYPYGEFNNVLQSLLIEMNFIGIGQHSGAIGVHSNFSRLPRFPASGSYANLKTLKTKLMSLPFDATLNADPIVANNPPKMAIQFNHIDFNKSSFRCYVSNQGEAKVNWIADKKVEITAQKKLAVGRSRYNCTAPSNHQSGRYFWLSQPWVTANQ